MSQYQDALADLEKHRCENCGGLGKIDDAAPGDISFREWACSLCKGTGFKEEL